MTKKTGLDWRYLLRFGLLASLFTFYVAVVGMIETFNEAEVIRDMIGSGQVLLFLASLIVGYFIAHKTIHHGEWQAIIRGAIVGFISSIFLVALIILSQILDLRPIFVNINRDLISILTFENESILLGSILLVIFFTVAGIIGAGFRLIPDKPRRVLLIGLVSVLVAGLMSAILKQILQQVLDVLQIDDDVLRPFFRSKTLKPLGALVVFIVSGGISLFWVMQGEKIQAALSTTEARRRNTRWSGFSLLGFVLLLLPWVLGSFLSDVTNTVGLYILMGLGLNIAVGLSGLLDLGYVTNFAVGAYVTGILISTGPQGLGVEIQEGIPFFNFWVILPISVLSAMVTGFLFALPVLKMRGDYLAIATLGFGEIIGILAKSDWFAPLIGGAQGILFIPKPNFFGTIVKDPEQIYYILLVACLVMIFVSTRINNSRTGRQWMAIREDEDAASAMGIDTAKAKLLAFTLSAATGGLAGAIFAMKVGTVFPNSFVLLVSVNVLSLIIVGGMGSIPGVVVGAVVLVGLPELLREFSEYRFLLYGALLVVMMLARPGGLWPSKVHQREMRSGTDPTDDLEASPALAGGD